MSEQAGYSPTFKRPAEIMRMRRKRGQSGGKEAFRPSGPCATGSPGQGASAPAGVRPFIPGPLFNTQNRTGGGLKRRNPFANIENMCNAKKKLLVHNEDEHDVNAKKKKVGQDETTEVGFGDWRKETEKGDCPTVVSKKCLSFSEEEEEEEEEEEGVQRPVLKSPSSTSVASPPCTEYPADWSLKTRLRFTSSLSLTWADQLKAQEEATGLSQHCRAHYPPLPPTLQDPRACPELRCAFQQSLVYWQHPSLPWLSLFPRMNADSSFRGKSTPWAQDAALQNTLLREWSISLSSLYSLLKARLCPYFYLCSHQFTVLFRAAGLSHSNISAVISPTTRGLREAMKAEGIEFSLPLAEERWKSKEAEPQSRGEEPQHKHHSPLETSDDEAGDDRHDDKDADEDEEEDEDGSFSWLKEMGVQDKINKPDMFQLGRERRLVRLDRRPESVACVEGSHAFTLVNFLINCKSTVASAGPQAGLPPTLLAPVAFRGAALHMLKARSVNVQTKVGNSYQNISSLEITGPVLPSSLHNITTILRPAQKGNYTTVLSTHTPTAVLNIHTQDHCGCALNHCGCGLDLSGCGLDSASIQQLHKPSPLGKTALTHISMKNYNYSWKN